MPQSENIEKRLAEILLRYIPIESFDNFLDDLKKGNFRVVTSIDKSVYDLPQPEQLQQWKEEFDEYFDMPLRPKDERDILLLVKHWISDFISPLQQQLSELQQANEELKQDNIDVHKIAWELSEQLSSQEKQLVEYNNQNQELYKIKLDLEQQLSEKDKKISSLQSSLLEITRKSLEKVTALESENQNLHREIQRLQRDLDSVK